MLHKPTLSVAAILSAMVVTSSTAWSSTILPVLGAYDFHGVVVACATGSASSCVTISSASTIFSQTGEQVISGGANAFGSWSLGSVAHFVGTSPAPLAPSVYGVADASGFGASAEAQLSLSYQMEVVGPGPTARVVVQATGVSTPLTGANQILFGLSGVGLLYQCFGYAPQTCTGGVRGGFSVNQELTLETSSVYTVFIQADAIVEVTNELSSGTSTQSVDPTFSFAPDFDATGYSLVFSPGIVNGTPLPAALPLFATGIGALGLLGWRRKRKAQAVAV